MSCTCANMLSPTPTTALYGIKYMDQVWTLLQAAAYQLVPVCPTMVTRHAASRLACLTRTRARHTTQSAQSSTPVGMVVSPRCASARPMPCPPSACLLIHRAERARWRRCGSWERGGASQVLPASHQASSALTWHPPSGTPALMSGEHAIHPPESTAAYSSSRGARLDLTWPEGWLGSLLEQQGRGFGSAVEGGFHLADDVGLCLSLGHHAVRRTDRLELCERQAV